MVTPYNFSRDFFFRQKLYGVNTKGKSKKKKRFKISCRPNSILQSDENYIVRTVKDIKICIKIK